VCVAHPPNWIAQEEAGRRIGEASGEPRRVAAIARGTRIERRAVALAPGEIGQLGTIEQRNNVYRETVPPLAIDAARRVLDVLPDETIGCLVTSSCTGYMVPGWDGVLVDELGLGRDTVRLPITEAGCAGGVVALAAAADYVRLHPQRKALAVAAELCSLAFHPNTEPGNLTAALLFGDGAGAALVESVRGARQSRIELVDALTTLVPNTRSAIGFDLTDRGFYPILTRELAELLPPPTRDAACTMLHRNRIDLEDVDFWLVHPGGARILSGLEECFGVRAGGLRWSWDSLRESGNMSSASIFDVMRRYLGDDSAPGGWGVIIGFGPGVSVEMLLTRTC
jgi:alkylresorcinol/alkylpyrone synthase